MQPPDQHRRQGHSRVEVSSAAKERGTSPGACPQDRAPLEGLEHWAGATNAFLVLPARRCCRKSTIQPFPFSAGTASKQQHLSAGHPAPPAEVGQELLWDRLRDKLWGWVSRAPRVLPGAARGGAGKRGLSQRRRVLQAVEHTSALPKALLQGGHTTAPLLARALPVAAAQPGHHQSKDLGGKVLPHYIPAAGGEERG